MPYLYYSPESSVGELAEPDMNLPDMSIQFRGLRTEQVEDQLGQFQCI